MTRDVEVAQIADRGNAAKDAQEIELALLGNRRGQSFAKAERGSAERIDLAVNLKTAEVLGLTVPRRILLRADAFRR